MRITMNDRHSQQPGARHRGRRACALALSLVALGGTAAWGHPTFNPNQLTPGEARDVDFVIPHGCTSSGGAPGAGEETSPTIQVAISLDPRVATFVATMVAGWDITTDHDAVIWSAAGGATTAPIVFPVRISLGGDAHEGDTLHLSVSQDCEEGSMLWSAGSGEDGLPAAILAVGESVGGAGHGDHAVDGAEGQPTPDGEAGGHEGGVGGDAPDGGEQSPDQEGHVPPASAPDGHVDDLADDHEVAGSASDGLGSVALLTLVIVIMGMVGILRTPRPDGA